MTSIIRDVQGRVSSENGNRLIALQFNRAALLRLLRTADEIRIVLDSNIISLQMADEAVEAAARRIA